MTIIITVIVGYEENGVFTIALSLVNIFYVFSSYGLRGFQVSDLKHKYSNNTYIFNRLFTILISFVVILLTSFIMQYNLYTIGIIMLFMAYKSFEALSDVYHGIMQCNGDLKYAGISLTLKGWISIAAFTLCLYLTKQLWISLLVIVLVALLLLLFFDLKKSKSIINLKELVTKENFKQSLALMKEALPMMLFMIATPLLASIPKIILEKCYDTTILGIYSSISTPSVIVSTLTTCIMTPLLPKWTLLYNEKRTKQLTKSFMLSCLVSGMIGVVGMIFSYFFGEFFLVLIFGEVMESYYFYLVYVILVSTITALIMCCNSYMVIARKLYPLLWLSFMGCALCLATSLVFIPPYEIKGVILSLIISETIQLVIMFIYIFIDIARVKKSSINNHTIID